MKNVLGPAFWNKLTRISNGAGMSPDQLLQVMWYESGLNPAAHNPNGNASGLIQFMPATLKGLGYTGKHDDFRELDAVQQLDYVQKYIQNKQSLNGGGFKSATQYYVANLWPIALQLPGVQAQDPSTVILDGNPTVRRYKGISLAQEKQAYNANKGLDQDHDGNISFGDLKKVMDSVRKSSGFQNALTQLQAGHDYTPPAPHEHPHKPGTKPVPTDATHPNSMVAQNGSTENKATLFDNFMKMFAGQNPMVIKIGSNHPANSLEFARILCLGLEEEVGAKTSIHSDGKQIEVFCRIKTRESKLCTAAVNQFSNVLAGIFQNATNKISSQIEIQVLENSIPSYQKLNTAVVNQASQRFRQQFKEL